ncbi:unnamed protein product [Prorocentrum cordatum]|uniref:Phospholipase B-like n=1 Tax=Prorocentrum cordatum TaxID=2364126 RepID=A0ABN9U9J0_9DINO|nr:unnamed protein product [Polarella glacialis]
MSLPDHWLSSLLDIVPFASPTRPRVEVHKHFFYGEAAYTTLDLWMWWLDTGHVGVAWRTAEVIFTARWCNPLWDITSDITAEHLKIVAMLHSAVQATIVQPTLPLRRADLAEAPALVPPSWAWRAWRWSQKAVAWAWPRAGSGLTLAGAARSPPTLADNVCAATSPDQECRAEGGNTSIDTAI